jgi:hypothetical protein
VRNSKELAGQVLDRLAFFVSALSSPYLICAGFSIWIIGQFSTEPRQFISLVVTFLSLAVILPLGFVVARVMQGAYSDIHVAILAQREEIFMVASASAGVLSLIYYAEKAPLALIGMALTLFVNGIIFWIISLRWKISMHSAAITQGSVIGAILLSPAYLTWLIALPAIVWARLRRKRHTIGQAIGGMLVVSITTPLIFWSIGIL